MSTSLQLLDGQLTHNIYLLSLSQQLGLKTKENAGNHNNQN